MKKNNIKKEIYVFIAAVSLSFVCIGCKGAEEALSVPPDEEIQEEQVLEETSAIPEKEAADEEEIPDEEDMEMQQRSPLFRKWNEEEFVTDINSLDNTSLSWGQGSIADEKNRPVGAIDYQDKFGDYAVDFIMEEENTIYLTFDEGYENGYTEEILNVLKEKDYQSVFFVTMDYVKRNPDLVRRMIEEGHVLGNHSTTHPSKGLPSQSLEEQEQELMQLHEYVLDNFGYEMYLFRYPAGIFSEQSLALLSKLGYTSVFWSFAYHDWDPENQMPASEALKKLEERMHPGAVYLLHAVSKTNTEVLGDFIDLIRESGYELQ